MVKFWGDFLFFKFSLLLPMIGTTQNLFFLFEPRVISQSVVLKMNDFMNERDSEQESKRDLNLGREPLCLAAQL